MNSKSAILAAAMGLALVSGAHAQTVIRLSGSTAFRGTVHTEIQKLLTGTTIAYWAPSGTVALNSATRANFTGNFNGTPVVIQVAWSGSAAGIEAVAKNLDVTFLAANTAGSSTGTQAATNAPTEIGKVDAALSDVFQASTPFTTPKLVDNRLCVVPFRWVINDSSATNLTNMTPGLAQQLYLVQSLPLSIFTGDPADRTSGFQVYGLGRDPDSGTRITMTAESGLGAFATVLQSQVDLDTAADTITNPVPFPQGTTVFATGNNGYDSGGKLAAALGAKSVAADKAVYVGYLGLSDYATAVNGNARPLNWNGVSYSATAVQEGLYSFWGYEHLFYANALTSNTAKFPFVTALKTNVTNTPGGAGLLLSDMKVSRPADGAPIGN